LELMGLRNRLRLALDRFAAWRTERRQRSAILHDLYSFDERDLQDLGISRYDFKAIANGTYRR